MSINHTIQLSDLSSASNTPIAGSQTETGSSEVIVDQNYSAGAANVPQSCAFTAAGLQAVVLLAAQNMTVTTNGTNEVQQVAITGTPTGGTFTMTFSGQTTAAIPYNATAAAVAAALQALSNTGANAITTTGGPLPGTPVAYTFVGPLGNTNVAQATTTDSLTGGASPASAVTTTTGGVAPSNTFNLVAGSPLIWSRSQSYFANPFSADVVQFNVTSTTANRLQAKVLKA